MAQLSALASARQHPVYELEASFDTVVDESHFERAAEELGVSLDELLAWHRVESAASSWRAAQRSWSASTGSPATRPSGAGGDR